MGNVELYDGESKLHCNEKNYDDDRCVLEQHVQLIFIMLGHWNKVVREYGCHSIRTHYSDYEQARLLFVLLIVMCLAEKKQQVYIFMSGLTRKGL